MENFAYMTKTGFDIGMRPSFWIPYQQIVDEVWSTADTLEKISEMKGLTIRQEENLDVALSKYKSQSKQFRFATIIAPMGDYWYAVVNKKGDILEYFSLD